MYQTTHITTCDEWKPNTSSGSEMPVRTVSQKFTRPWWGKMFKELWGRPTTTADFGSSFWHVSFAEDRSLTWSTSTSGSLEPLILSRIMPTYLQLFFEMMIFRNSIRNGTKFLSMTQIPSDEILERLYKLRIRESEKLKTVLELYKYGNSSDESCDYHRLTTTVKRSIEQNLRIKNFEPRNGNYETNAVVKNQGDKTAWTKNSRRLLAMESQRAVFERRQLQFPARYE